MAHDPRKIRPLYMRLTRKYDSADRPSVEARDVTTRGSWAADLDVTCDVCAITHAVEDIQHIFASKGVQVVTSLSVCGWRCPTCGAELCSLTDFDAFEEFADLCAASLKLHLAAADAVERLGGLRRTIGKPKWTGTPGPYASLLEVHIDREPIEN